MSHTVTAVQLNYPATTNTSREEVQFDDPEEKQSVLFGCLATPSFCLNAIPHQLHSTFLLQLQRAACPIHFRMNANLWG